MAFRVRADGTVQSDVRVFAEGSKVTNTPLFGMGTATDATNRMRMYRIADPGPGFTFEDLPHSAVSYPDASFEHMRVREEQGLRPGGFGLLMVKASVDELVYNEKHNEVIFIKYLDPDRL